jgi:hypothetical protein
LDSVKARAKVKKSSLFRKHIGEGLVISVHPTMALIILVGGIVKFTLARRIDLPKAFTAQLMIPLKQE